MDTTSLYFEGAGGQTLGRYGFGFRRIFGSPDALGHRVGRPKFTNKCFDYDQRWIENRISPHDFSRSAVDSLV
jgi:hypothetical protein